MLGLASFARAQEEPPSANFSNRMSLPDANANLPAQIEAAPGKLSLFADFKNPGEKGISLYLVNRTDKTVDLESQDGDAYVKLEYQNASGEWERAQAHAYSDCGNSYGGIRLQPGMYLRMSGYQPVGGRSARIRYSSYPAQELVSNVGEGLYSPADVSDASLDRLSSVGMPGAVRGYFEAGWRMSQSPRLPVRVAALKLASLMGEFPSIRKAAGKWADELKAQENPTPDQQAALSAVGEILGADWGGKTGTGRVLESCFVALKSDGGSATAFGALEKERVFAWTVIREIAEREAGWWTANRGVYKSDSSLWKNVFDLTTSRVKTSPGDEAAQMSGILSVRSLADEFVSDQVFEDLLDAKDSWLARVAAEALSRRGKWGRLADLGFQLDPEHQLIVLGALGRGAGYAEGWTAYGAYREPTLGYDADGKFWMHVFATQPAKAASALRGSWSDGHTAARSERSGYYKPLVEFWEHEVQRSDRPDQDFELSSDADDYRNSVAFLTADPRKEDIPFLKALLRYRGYAKSIRGREVAGLQGTRECEYRNFGVRGVAAEALKKLGEPVPEDMVFHTEILTGAPYEYK